MTKWINPSRGKGQSFLLYAEQEGAEPKFLDFGREGTIDRNLVEFNQAKIHGFINADRISNAVLQSIPCAYLAYGRIERDWDFKLDEINTKNETGFSPQVLGRWLGRK